MMPEPISDGATASAPARPFPWYCANCRRKEVRRVTIPYQCQLLHMGQPVTIVLPSFAVPKCGNCGELAIDYEADDQIHQAFAAEIDKIRRRQQSAVIAPPMVRPDGQQQPLEPRSKGH